MDIHRWRHVQTLFSEAVALEPGHQEAFLREECPDEELRREVEELLNAHASEGPVDALGAIWTPASAALDVPEASRPVEGRRIGPYRLVRPLGRGGMGEVFLADRDDGQFERSVALKLLRSGLGSPSMRDRFLRERRMLARLEHPGIARLLDGGLTDDGRPYFAMEVVHGEPIDQYCDHNRLGVDARLRLFAQVCEAVHHAHQRLVVHRDLKPANVLVTEHEGATGSGDQTPRVKLLDFGIAKLLEDVDADAQTVTRLLTPEYAAPEQVMGEEISTATDVYALGVLLYELLTGTRPLPVADLAPGDAIRAICETPPPAPSTAVGRADPEAASSFPTDPETHARRLRGDLDTICLKALDKDPARRYASVEAFLDDIRRHLDGLPVRARPATVGYRVRSFVRRHRTAVVTASFGLLVLVGALAGMTWQAREAAMERDRARTEAAKAEQVATFLSEIFGAADPSQAEGETLSARDLLDRGARRVDAELADQPDVQATMLDVIARSYVGLGFYDAAEPLAQRALHIRRDLHGGEHPDVATSLATLAWLHHESRDLDAAERFHRWALAMRERVLPAGHADTEDSRYWLGWLFYERGDQEEAVALFREAVAQHRARGDTTTAGFARALFGLGSSLHGQMKFDEGEAAFRQSAAVYRTLPSADLFEASTTYVMLAQLERIRGNLAEAEALVRDAYDARLRLYGPEHVHTLTVGSSLALLLRDLARYEEADSLATAGLEISERVLGPGHEVTAYFLQAHAYTLASLGDYRDAAPLIDRHLALTRELLGPESPQVVAVLIEQGEFRIEAGEVDAAARSFREALALGRRTMGDEHPFVVTARGGLARVAYRRGATAEAERGLRSALATAEATLRPDHARILTLRLYLADVLRDRRQYDEAEAHYRAVLAMRREDYPEGHVRLAPFLISYGRLLRERGRGEEAAPLLREALGLREAVLPEAHPLVAEARDALAGRL